MDLRKFILCLLIIIMLPLVVGCEPTGSSPNQTYPDNSTKDNNVSQEPPLIKNFETEGVTVEIPWQGKELDVRQGDFDSRLLQNPVQEGYQIIRPVIFYEVIDSSDQVVHEFNPAMTVTVSYTEQDIEESGDPYNLVLLVYDSNQELWVAYDTEINTSEMTGTISISNWTSHICWGF